LARRGILDELPERGSDPKATEVVKPGELNLLDRSTPEPRGNTGPFSFLQPPHSEGELGRLGPYRVLKLLGAGAMGLVFQAQDVQLGRLVALKVIKPELATHAAARARFFREARAAAALEHENIVTIYQVGEQGGVPFIALQLLKGQSLEERRRKGPPLAIEEVLRLGRQIALGLAAAHQADLIHRDVKPANLWLEPGGRVKVLDFGLARPVADDARLTQSGAIIGTPAYLAPEQARCDKVDARCDLFSLGTVLFELCTGRLPFAGDNSIAVLIAVALETPPSMREINPAVPPTLEDLVMQLLAKEPEQRPASAQEVADRLAAIEEHRQSHPEGPQRPENPPQGSTSRVARIPPAPPPQPPGHSPPAAPPPVTAPPVTSHEQPAPRSWRPGCRLFAAAVLVAAPLAWFFGGQAVHFARNQGQIVLVGDPALALTVKVDGAAVPAGVGQVLTLPAGPRELEVAVKDAAGAVRSFTKRFSLSRGSKQALDVAGELARQEDEQERQAANQVLKLGGRITIRVGDKDRQVQSVKELPSDAFHITKVYFYHNQQVTDAGLEPIGKLTHLSSLWLYGTKITDSGLRRLATLVNLSELEIARTQVGDPGIAHLSSLSRLRTLVLTGTRVSDNGLKHLAALTNLSGLHLAETRVGDAGLEHLGGLTRLTHLDLSRTRVTNAGLAGLRRMKHLSRLDLSGTQVDDTGLTHLQWLTNLNSLGLRFTRVGDAGLKSLSGLRWLESLDLSETEVGDTGLEHLTALGRLSRLDLGETQISDAGLVHLMALRKVDSLGLRGTRLSVQGRANLKRALPKATIAWSAPPPREG
jgi:serine/threonine protein kinase